MKRIINYFPFLKVYIANTAIENPNVIPTKIPQINTKGNYTNQTNGVGKVKRISMRDKYCTQNQSNGKNSSPSKIALMRRGE